MTTAHPSRGARQLLRSTVTPLASILGSGLLIIVPVLERTLGALSLLGALGVCALAWLIGTAIRHNVAVVEPAADSGQLDRFTQRLETAADAVIVVAYVISVALYLRIMAQYVVGYLGATDGALTERLVACAAVLLITGVGVVRGFSGLDRLDRVSLSIVLTITTVLGIALLVVDARAVVGPGLTLPPVPDDGVLHALLVLGGIVITVQGFETVRYLGAEYDATTRIRASRLAQLLSTSIYLGFVLLATPAMGLGTPAGADPTLLTIMERVAPLLALPLVVSAVLSQFAAATADTAAAEGNLGRLSRRMRGRRAFVTSGVAAIALAATVPAFTIVAVASRAFALYYAVQAVVALRTCDRLLARGGFGVLAVLMLAITLFAQPAG